ncbi:MAG: methyltransferase domain-containing protein [Nitrospira sp.]|nr:methyltransferase domain-containing protein [Nitrospira sp.]MBP8116086.1 methyltransferase domain-containing protein [Nitrospira sp.]
MADSRAVNFLETSYGIVKRLQVIEVWTAGVARRLGTPSLSILDFGCGTGDHVTYPLACLGHRVLGVDMHEPSIQEAQRRYPMPNLLFRTGRLESLIEEGHSFDLIVCSEVLEHLYRPQDCLALLRRLLKPVGTLVITTPNGYGSYELLCRLQRGLTSLGIDQLLRRAVHARRERKARAVEAATCAPVSALNEQVGFLNFESGHVQFFRVRRLLDLFHVGGFRVTERRARTFLCGPYIDVLLRLPPFRQTLYRMNNRVADLLPFSWSADWMFLLEPTEKRPG